MNCPNCGTPLSEGSKFCNSCGAPLPTVAPVQTYNPSSTNPYQPPVQPEPKNSNTGLIIGAVIAVAVIVVVFCVLGFVKPGFLLDKSNPASVAESSPSVSEKTESNLTTVKPSSAPEKPAINLDDAEKLTETYYETVVTVDLVTLCNSEILGWKRMEKLIEKLLVDAVAAEIGYTMSIDSIFDIMAGEYGCEINDVEDYFKAFLRAGNTSGLAVDCRVNSSKEISKRTAESYISKTKAEIDLYNDVGLNSADFNWDNFEAYAQVDCTLIEATDSADKITILGLINGDWVVLYSNSPDGTSNCLGSLSFIEGMVE